MSQRLSRSVYVCWYLQSAFNFVSSRQDTGLSSCVSVASVCHFLYHIAGVLHLVWRKSVSNVLSFFCVIEESTVLCGILSRIRCIGKRGPVIPTLAAAAWTILSQMVKLTAVDAQNLGWFYLTNVFTFAISVWNYNMYGLNSN